MKKIFRQKLFTLVMVSFLLFANTTVVLADNIDDSITENEEKFTTIDNQDELLSSELSTDNSEVNEKALSADEYNDEEDTALPSDTPAEETPTENEVESNLDVATSTSYLAYEDAWSNTSDIKEYTFNIDFSEMDSAAICLVRTGLNNTSVKVIDSDKHIISTLTSSDKQAKKWIFIDKPSSDSLISTYTLKVKPINYNPKKSSSYRIMVGNKESTEKMMSGFENAVELDMYFEEDMNFQSESYLPNHEESFYKISGRCSREILTIMLRNNFIRFRIYDTNHMPVLDSNDANLTNRIHRTSYVGTWTCAEKEDLSRITTNNGPYYIGLYNTNPQPGNDLIKSNYIISYGNPMMSSSSVSIYPQNTITINSNRFTESTFTIDERNNVPNTAQASSISYSGTVGSDIQYFRAMPPDGWWANASSYRPGVDFSYIKDSSYNSRVRGTWTVAFQASRNSRNNRIRPYYTISYYYEYGD